MNTTFLKNLITAAFRVEIAEKCAFEEILPNPVLCPKPGLFVELLVFVLNFFQRNPKVKLIGTTRTSLAESDRARGTDNDTSVIGLLLAGRANVSFPLCSLTYERAKGLLYSTPLYTKGLYYMYKDTPDITIAQLNLSQLFVRPYLFFAILLLIFYLAKKLIFLQTVVRIPLKSATKKRVILGQSLALAIFLGCLSSHMVMVFNIPSPKRPKPITNQHDLLKAIESKQYTALVSPGSAAQDFLEAMPNTELGKRFIAATKHNRPIFIKSEEQMRRLLLKSSRKIVAIGGWNTYSRLRDDCNLYSVEDYEVMTVYKGLYFSPSWKLPTSINRVQIKQIHGKYEELYEKYRPHQKACWENATKGESGSTTVMLGQIQGAFWCFAIVQSIAILAFCLENAAKILKARLGRRNRGTVPVCSLQDAELGKLANFNDIAENMKNSSFSSRSSRRGTISQRPTEMLDYRLAEMVEIIRNCSLAKEDPTALYVAVSKFSHRLAECENSEQLHMLLDQSKC